MVVRPGCTPALRPGPGCRRSSAALTRVLVRRSRRCAARLLCHPGFRRSGACRPRNSTPGGAGRTARLWFCPQPERDRRRPWSPNPDAPCSRGTVGMGLPRRRRPPRAGIAPRPGQGAEGGDRDDDHDADDPYRGGGHSSSLPRRRSADQQGDCPLRCHPAVSRIGPGPARKHRRPVGHAAVSRPAVSRSPTTSRPTPASARTARTGD